VNTAQKLMKAVSCSTSGTGTSDFFTLNLDAWDQNGQDPVGGSDLTIRGTVYVSAIDVTSGIFLVYIVWFTFQRYLGTITVSIDQAFGNISMSGSVSSHTAKLQVTGTTIGHTVNYDGVVHYQGHY
jgi:hypothetical protein